MNRLLNKSLKSFTVYALIVLAASVPAYYYLVDSIWLSELDEHNELVAKRTEKEFNDLNLSKAELNQSIALWNSIQPETNLKKTTSTYQKPDSTYVIVRKNPYAKRYETNRFRGLSRVIKIKGESYLLNIETNVEETEETAIAIAVLTFFFFGFGYRVFNS